MGDGHAMSWRAGAEFTMMEKSVRAEWSGDRSFPPYSTGNNHNTWYACNMVDSEGNEIPWINRDGVILNSFIDRYKPAKNQKFFIKGGCESDFPDYEFQGPDTIPTKELLRLGFKLPFYADLGSMPEMERKAIWGLMVGEEGKTRIPVHNNYLNAGFDPDKDMLKSYGQGWKSALFKENERQLFGLPGGLFNDWSLRTNLEGLYAAGDQLFASNCFGHAAATGDYAARHAWNYAKKSRFNSIDEAQIQLERKRIYASVMNTEGISWKNINIELSGLMQEYCGAVKNENKLSTGLSKISELKIIANNKLKSENPHELTRSLEVLSILTNAEIILHSCLARKASSKHLHFLRSDYPDNDPPEWHKFITIYQKDNGDIRHNSYPINYYGDLKTEYELINKQTPY